MATIVIKGNSSGTGSVTLESPNTNSDYTVTLPAASGTLGAGDVVGPASATDNAVARFDGTSGKAIQTSNVTIADDGTTVISVNSSSDALRITQVGSGNALLVEDSANPDASPFVIDASGREIIGYTVALSKYNDFNGTARTPQIQLQGSSLSTAGLAQTNWSAANSPPVIFLSKSRSSTIGTQSVVLNNDSLGAIQFNGDDATNFIPGAAIFGQVDGTPGTNDMPGRLVFSTTADGASTPTEQMRITSTGDLRFNSGYGSVATAYGCRAWVNFNGTGTPAIRSSGNVSSITDNATGVFTPNFTTSMPDTDYAWVGTCEAASNTGGIIVCKRYDTALTTGAVRLQTLNVGNAAVDPREVYFAVFR